MALLSSAFLALLVASLECVTSAEVNCTDLGGVCAPLYRGLDCAFLDGKCPLIGITCCLDDCNSAPKQKCYKNHGTCKPSCEMGEYVVQNGCFLPNCTCCAPCLIEKSCYLKGGFCVSNKLDCEMGTLLDSGCKGKGCKCCVPILKAGETGPLKIELGDFLKDNVHEQETDD